MRHSKQALLGKKIPVQWAIMAYYKIPATDFLSRLGLCVTQHAGIHTTRTPARVNHLRGVVDSVLDFCALSKGTFSVKEHISLTDQANGFESLPRHIFFRKQICQTLRQTFNRHFTCIIHCISQKTILHDCAEISLRSKTCMLFGKCRTGCYTAVGKVSLH